MIFYDAAVTPDNLVAFIREVPLPKEHVLSNLFNVVNVQSNKFDWSEVLQTNRTARFRSYDGRIHVSERDGGTDKTVAFPALSDSLNQGEYERLKLEFARTGGTRQQALANAIYNDAQRLTRHVQNRMEQAIGDVLVDGKLTIAENGFTGEADFGLAGNHNITVGTVWTNTAATALDHLIAAVDQYVADNGFAPGGIITSTRVKRLMCTNLQLIGAAVGTTMGKTRINEQELADLLSSENLPSYITTCDNVVDVDGVTTRVIPDDKLILVPPSPDDMLDVRYGISATSLELVGSNQSEMDFEEAPGIVGVVIKDGPPFREFTYVDAVGMPVLKDARKLMVMDVA